MFIAILFFVLGYAAHNYIKDEVTSIIGKIKKGVGKQ